MSHLVGDKGLADCARGFEQEHEGSLLLRGEVEIPGRRIPRRHVIASAFGLGVLALLVYSIPALSAQWQAAALWGLYAVPSNSVIPIPHEPGLLYFALTGSPWVLAVIGSLGVFCAAYFDQWLVGWAMARKVGRRLRDARSWQRTQRVLMRRPFPTLMGVAFLGFPPIQAVRVVVLSAGYSVHRYAVAVALGRLPRFLAIASLGYAVALPAWLTLGVALAFVGWAAVLVFRPHHLCASGSPRRNE
jgi:uncharacterized membrane protein YdjX (TVP38/TMEM64 family)